MFMVLAKSKLTSSGGGGGEKKKAGLSSLVYIYDQHSNSNWSSSNINGIFIISNYLTNLSVVIGLKQWTLTTIYINWYVDMGLKFKCTQEDLKHSEVKSA